MCPRVRGENRFSAVAGQRGPARAGFAPHARYAQTALIVLTLACLLPFIGKAVHIDDPIFIWTAKQVTRHPLNPYGFTTLWGAHATPMWRNQQNPPLAAYFMALIGSAWGWSERALHLGCVFPALVAVLATYRLAQRFTRLPFLAAAATLLAPGFLISATGVMCDVSMLALWMLALLLWVDGLEASEPAYLLISGILIAACALTKYFGMALVPLLFVYSLVRRRRVGGWLVYLALPLVLLGLYEFYTHRLYGYGLIEEAMLYKSFVRERESSLGRALVGLSFAGGCMLPALTFIPLLWSRRQIVFGGMLSGVLAFSFYRGWINVGSIYDYERWFHHQRQDISAQLFFFIAGGLSLLALALADWWKRKEAASLLLLLWVFGTLFFGVVINWDINARSILATIPAAAILIARRLDDSPAFPTRLRWTVCAMALMVSAAVSLWVAAGDMALANTARQAANYIQQKTRGELTNTWFEGRWGFEYYMLAMGARPLEVDRYSCDSGDLVVTPEYNTALFEFPLQTTSEQTVDFEIHTWVTTMNPDAGAGFYFSGWGPLPYVFGPVPNQRYTLARVVQAIRRNRVGW